MKNKKNLFILIAVILSFGVVITFASGIVMLTPDSEEDIKEVSSDIADIEVSISSFEKENELDSNETIREFVSDFDMHNLSYEEYLSAESYLNFVLKHNLSDDELSAIDDLIKNGTTVDTIADIYKFYLTTNEDFGIISEIAQLEDEIWGKNWIENAFNKITQNKHGVITASEAPEYMAEFENGEILYANILCRKGVYTIQEILEMHKNGTSWSEITDSVYSSVISSEKLTGSKAERNNIFIYLNSPDFRYDEAPYDIYILADRCARYKVDLGGATVDTSNITELKKKITDEIDDTYIPAVNKLKEAAGLPERYMTSEEYAEYYNEYHSKALASGMSENEIELLELKGYSMEEIASGSEKAKDDIPATIKSIKAQRGAEIK